MSESVIVVRPFKMMGEVFAGVAGVFLIIASVGQDWVEVQFFRTSHVITWGLWDICVGGLCLPDSALLDLLTLIVYPVMFNTDIVHLQADSHWQYTLKTWNFDWTYGFGWGAFIFTVAASLFFILPLDDKKTISKPFRENSLR